ncbi:MAG: nitroreductase family protein, partial [Rhodopirellula bahusiensis]
MSTFSSTSPNTKRLHDRLRTAVESATAAPSSHNTQPWKFRILQDRIELYADRSRRLPIVDPMDRALTISCGAALDHLCLAMHCDGLSTMVRVLPEPDNPDLLARVIVSGPHLPSDEERMIQEAIPKRRTNRCRLKRSRLIRRSRR